MLIARQVAYPNVCRVYVRSSTFNVHPNVHVGISTEKPEHVLALQLPHVPHVVVAEIYVAIERKREAIYAAALLDVAQGFVNVFPAEGHEQIGQHFFNQFLLVAAHLGHGQPGQFLFARFELDSLRRLLAARIAEQRLGALFTIERIEDFIGPFGLIPVHIAGMVWLLGPAAGVMAVKDRAAEGRALDRIAVAAHRAMAPGQHKLEPPSAWLAEKRNRVIPQIAAVVFDVSHHLLDISRVVHAAENLFDHRLLVAGEEFADEWARDTPIIVNFGLQRMIEVKRDYLFLRLGEATMERRNQRLGLALAALESRGRKRRRQCGHVLGSGGGPVGQTSNNGGLEKVATRRRALIS